MLYLMVGTSCLKLKEDGETESGFYTIRIEETGETYKVLFNFFVQLNYHSISIRIYTAVCSFAVN